ncbi:hypothetical protein [Eudoraea adriatica]|nr:hypothetical protein [Eudoraea adriatica]
MRDEGRNKWDEGRNTRCELREYDYWFCFFLFFRAVLIDDTTIAKS